ncbi:MAG: hypothetical protein HY023_06900 [Chloroflexi bacterium]|nr:hypothetical protein [Chloroflexota bacterium]MBI3761160.1 hypothetical protein [Chloroflexota bacterium]
MAVQTITLNLPDTIYRRVKRTAETLKRPLDEVIAEVLSVALLPLDEVPPEMADRLPHMASWKDTELWQAARSTVTTEQQERLAILNDKHQRTGDLSSEETSEQRSLLALYGETILVRAHAAMLLKQRGYDISDPEQLSSAS